MESAVWGRGPPWAPRQIVESVVLEGVGLESVVLEGGFLESVVLDVKSFRK